MLLCVLMSVVCALEILFKLLPSEESFSYGGNALGFNYD